MNGLSGTAELNRALARYGSAFQDEVEQHINATAQGVRTSAVRAIQRGPASGVTYEKYQPRRTHTASAPGEAPKTDTGRLASSVSVRESGGLEAFVFTPVEYGKHLEFGTRHVAARPWLFPAMEKQKDAWERGLRRLSDEAARRARR